MSEPKKFEVPARYEDLSEDRLSSIRRSMSRLQAVILELSRVDVAKGVGVLSGNSKCVWLCDGRRLTMSSSAGALICSLSKEVDPLSNPGDRSQ